MGILATRSATAVTVEIVDFFPGDITQFNGPSATLFDSYAPTDGGLRLSSQLNGSAGSQLAFINSLVVGQGLGVGQPSADGPNIGFTRSINNNGTNSEGIQLDLPSVGFNGLSNVVVANASNFVDGDDSDGVDTTTFNGFSTIVISGFSADPQATIETTPAFLPATTIDYSAGTLTINNPWKPEGSINSTISFGNPSAVAAGSSLVFTNGNSSGAGGQYGLRSFELVESPNVMRLRVNTTTGEVFLDPGSVDQDVYYLQVNSAANGLVGAGYTGLGATDDFPDGGGIGTGWDQAPSNATSTSVVAEVYGLGSSVITGGGDEIPLGAFYNTTADTRDLVFSFDLAADGSTINTGNRYVEYFQTALIGDYNGDGSVNLADYTVWRDNLGADESVLANPGDGSGTVDIGDYMQWKSNFAPSSSGLDAIATDFAVVPEPSTTVSLVVFVAVGFVARRCQNIDG